ncbi:MAG TPA: DUF2075 domain-containing protein [bacterium]|nr:DUF2075 domain-containing protein [bacterium]
MKLSIDQQKCKEAVIDWYKSSRKKQFITLGGYAGTGKTTLIATISQDLRKINKKISIAFCSYTGKATQVFKHKLEEQKAISPSDSISTIHSLIYSPILNLDEEIAGWKLKDEIKADLIIVDESSMLSESIWNDLTSYNLPIIAVGDHGQLPPIEGKFNLMEKPQLRLEKIHRQAEENPIIKWSIVAREEGEIPIISEYSEHGVVKKFSRRDPDSQEEIGDLLESFNEDLLVLCGYNWTRLKLNEHIRKSRGNFTEKPIIDERVICLRNNHEENIYNGMLGRILKINEAEKGWYFAEIEMDGESSNYTGLISVEQFNNPKSMNFTNNRSKIMKGDLFDFGYALTVHKSQGSQSPKVLLFEERFKSMDDDMWRRWLYTGITRAENELYIVGRE